MSLHYLNLGCEASVYFAGRFHFFWELDRVTASLLFLDDTPTTAETNNAIRFIFFLPLHISFPSVDSWAMHAITLFIHAFSFSDMDKFMLLFDLAPIVDLSSIPMSPEESFNRVRVRVGVAVDLLSKG